MNLSRANITQIARENVRNALSTSKAFADLGYAEQMQLYSDMYAAEVDRLNTEIDGDRQLPAAMAGKKPEKASDLIDDARHRNIRIEQAGELAGRRISSD